MKRGMSVEPNPDPFVASSFSKKVGLHDYYELSNISPIVATATYFKPKVLFPIACIASLLYYKLKS